MPKRGHPMSLSDNELAYGFWLASENLRRALDTEDDNRARRQFNKVIKANKRLRHDLGWSFTNKDRTDMVIEAREQWWEFGDILESLEESYGIEYEEEED